MTDIAILPLALTVMLGPQILVGMLLITRKDPVKSSLVYVLAIIATLISTTYLYYLLANITDLHKASIGNKPLVKYFLIVVFIFLIIRSIVNRNKITEPPKWMQGISTASLGKIFVIGFCLIAFMPTDIAIAFSVANLLNSESNSFLEAMPFFGAVLFISILPLAIYFSLGSNGSKYLEKINIWLNTHGYIINVIVLTFFILLLI
ncbi:GAP family protein [Polaribacter batillariae]|uniref:GAP family protein n=1 Tax=Polaribacter batillariae TaxID=2808900 RepID=A0ABX7SWD7_9FLAO|nr:GAP family protein [Polaribacter batillariae]QTD38570.1 GAP family protein [Polaribacter batillariae]